MGSRKVKRKMKKVTKIVGIILIVLIVLGCVGGFLLFNKDTIFVKSTKKKVEVKENTVQAKKEQIDYEAKVFMIGDALIHSTVYMDGHKSDGSYDFKPMLRYIKPISSKYDIAYYNQETILGGVGLGLSNYPQFNSPQEVGDAFVDAGFNMVSLATNHTMDKYEPGVLASVDYWKRQQGVATSGQWNSYEDRAEGISKIYEVNNIKYAFISYTIWTNGLETPYGKDYLNNVYSEEKAAQDVAAVRDKVDFVIVAMHWGTEYSFKKDYRQVEIANYLSGLGVDLIIGAHPHVVQTVGYVNKTFVIYSLGNFVSDQLDIDNYVGLAMEVTLRKHVDLDGKVTNSVVEPKAQLIYTVTDQAAWHVNFRVKPFPQLTDSDLNNHGYYYDLYKNIVNEDYPNLTWGLTWE